LTKARGGRAEREATALRANLRKRKEQARLREQPPAESDRRPRETADAWDGTVNEERLPVSRSLSQEEPSL